MTLIPGDAANGLSAFCIDTTTRTPNNWYSGHTPCLESGDWEWISDYEHNQYAGIYGNANCRDLSYSGTGASRPIRRCRR